MAIDDGKTDRERADAMNRRNGLDDAASRPKETPAANDRFGRLAANVERREAEEKQARNDARIAKSEALYAADNRRSEARESDQGSNKNYQVTSAVIKGMQADARISQTGEYIWAGEGDTPEARDKDGAKKLSGALTGNIAQRNEKLAELSNKLLDGVKGEEVHSLGSGLGLLQSQSNDGLVDSKERGTVGAALKNAKEAQQRAEEASKALDIATNGDQGLIEERTKFVESKQAEIAKFDDRYSEHKKEVQAKYERDLAKLSEGYNPADPAVDLTTREQKQTEAQKLQIEHQKNMARIDSDHEKSMGPMRQEVAQAEKDIENAGGYTKKIEQWKANYPLADETDGTEEEQKVAASQNATRALVRQQIEAEYQKSVDAALNAARESKLQMELAKAQATLANAPEGEKGAARVDVAVLESELAALAKPNAASARQQAENAEKYTDNVQKGENARAALKAESIDQFKTSFTKNLDEHYDKLIAKQKLEVAKFGGMNDDAAQTELDCLIAEKEQLAGKIKNMPRDLSTQINIVEDRLKNADMDKVTRSEIKGKLWVQGLNAATEGKAVDHNAFASNFLKRHAPEQSPVNVADIIKAQGFKDKESGAILHPRQILNVEIRDGGVMRLYSPHMEGGHTDIYTRADDLRKNGIDMTGMNERCSLLMHKTSGFGPEDELALFKGKNQYVSVRATSSDEHGFSRNGPEDYRLMADAVSSVRPVDGDSRMEDRIAMKAASLTMTANDREEKMVAVMLKRLDKDKDGQVSQSELAKLDRDKDGKLTKSEMGGNAVLAQLMDKNPSLVAALEKLKTNGSEVAIADLGTLSIAAPGQMVAQNEKDKGGRNG